MRVLGAFSVLSALVGALADPALQKRDTPKLVFAHFLVGLVSGYTEDNWRSDFTLAMQTGIDAFALNIGFQDSWTDTQLSFAYTVANEMGFKLFISFDFSTVGSVDAQAYIIQHLQWYAPNGANVQWGNGALVSTFIGDGFDWGPVKAAVPHGLEVIPNYQAADVNGVNIDGAYQWNAWPSQNNQPINSSMNTDGDKFYQSQLQGRPYMANVSPWFFTHFGVNSFNKNFLFLSDTLFIDRWNEMLQLSPQPQLIEIATWNDYGESHYVGPLHPELPSVYPGNSADWVAGFPHDGWRQIIKPYIQAYKNGGAVQVQSDSIVYWYRPFPKGTSCSDPVPPPTGSNLPADSVWAAALLTAPATLTISSPDPVSKDLPAGINYFAGGMGNGQPTFTLTRNGNTILSGHGGFSIQNSNCQKYNFNAFVGTIPLAV